MLKVVVMTVCMWYGRNKPKEKEGGKKDQDRKEWATGEKTGGA